MLLTFLKGFATGGGLIMAIGAQNAFVLSQGVKKNHIILIPLICAFCDALLITAGVSGTGTLMAANKSLTLAAGIGGAAFLFFYGIQSFRSAIRGGSLSSAQAESTSLKTAILTTLAVTLLNPHVYIDTILLLGGISSQFPHPGPLFFGGGAILASIIWFFFLSLGGRVLAPIFARESAWRILDTLVGLTMWGLAVSLLRGLAAS